ncbi:MAG TPA: alpha/beta hydrolase [Planctomycetota bacterium]|nr:alpha/beta hydrolase [Planctomycetota bacterium]
MHNQETHVNFHRLPMATLIALATLASGCSHHIVLTNLTDATEQPEELIYKTAGGQDLKLYVFYPPGFEATDSHAAIVCIHGGGWCGGTPQLFFPHALYLASRGAVAFSVNYRISSDRGPTVFDCLADCKSAIRYIRANSAKFGIDPNRIAVVGDSAGGHLAAALGTINRFDEPGEDTSISSMANAMLLYNPVLDLLPLDWAMTRCGIAEPDAAKLAGQRAARILTYGKTPQDRAAAFSPMHNVANGQPPALLIHGTEDKSAPVEQARRFADIYTKSGNYCDLHILDGIAHAFVLVHYTAPDNIVVDSIRAGDNFLVSLGYLKGKPTLEVEK